MLPVLQIYEICQESTKLYRLLVKTSLEIVEGSLCLVNSSQGVGPFQDGSVLVCHQFREPVCFKFVNTGLDIDGDKVLDEGHLFRGLCPCVELGALGSGCTIDSRYAERCQYS